MGLERDEDKLEGEFGKRRGASPGGRTSFPDVSVSGSSKRARRAWFNRPRGAGRVKLASVRPAGSQRVIVKIKPVVHATVKASGGAGSLMRHALYVEREGAGRDGDPVQVFDAEHERADGAAFVERCSDDRHHFRVILSPEYGGAFEDLKDYTRELVRTVERDLKTRLDWIAAEHHDTGRPHVHLLIRGKREEGRDLIIPREYVSHSFRNRAEAIATRELGQRLEAELGKQLERKAERAVHLERATHLDRQLRTHAREDLVRVADLPAPSRERGALVQRLNRLEDWGLSKREGPGLWQLDADLDAKLARLGDVRDRERATARLLAQENRGLEPDRTRELEGAHSSQRITGRLIGFEKLGSDLRGPYLLAVEGIDGKLWTARVARLEELRVLNGVEPGAIVELERASPSLKPADRTIWAIARENGLSYSAELHRELRPDDRETYIRMHERRLEALGREGIVSREPDGAFRLPGDYLSRASARESLGGRESARVTLIDPHSIDHQARYHGPTWLDRMGEGKEDLSQLRHEGFGREVGDAWKQRETTLEKLGLGQNRADGFHPAEDWHDRLSVMEQETLQQRIERETGRVARFAMEGDRVSGLYTSRIHLAQESFALIEHGRTVTLAPWRPEMDRALNQFVRGEVNERGFDFEFGHKVEKSVMKGLGLGR